jgi:hypothetical protein
VTDIVPLFHGEMQLMNWGESSANGAWVKFWITPEDLEAFRDLKCRSGKIAGHRMMVAMVEVADDETPVSAPPKAETPKGGALAKLAALWSGQATFHTWLRKIGCTCDGPEDAAECIRQTCEVQSRAELDSDPRAAQVFQDKIRGPYMRYMQGANR